MGGGRWDDLFERRLVDAAAAGELERRDRARLDDMAWEVELRDRALADREWELRRRAWDLRRRDRALRRQKVGKGRGSAKERSKAVLRMDDIEQKVKAKLAKLAEGTPPFAVWTFVSHDSV